MPPLNEFIDRLIEEKGLQDLELDVLDELKADLTSRLEDQLNATIIANLPPNKLEEFENIITGGSDEENQVFIKTHVPDLEAILAKQMVDFRLTYIG